MWRPCLPDNGLSVGEGIRSSTRWRALSSGNTARSTASAAVTAAGTRLVSSPKPTASATFACFYVYGTVSGEPSVNADLRRGQAEINSALVQADPFSPVCQVYAPIYRQVTLADLETHPDLNFGPAETVTA